jgi:hypothetical protein
MEEERLELREAARVVKVTPQRLQRAKKAKEENRCVGTVDKPKLLTPKGEAELVSAIVNAEKAKKAMSYHQVREKVCVHPTFFLHVFMIYLSHNTYIYHIYRLKTFMLTNLSRIWLMECLHLVRVFFSASKMSIT